MKRWRLLLADDHDIVISGLRQVLNEPEFDVVGAVKDGRALIQAAQKLQPDVIIADITMPLLNGIDAARQIRKTDPDVKIVFLTMHSEVGYANEALGLEGCAYVLKSSAADELPEAIHQVLQGHSYVARTIAPALQRSRQNHSPRRGPVRDQLTPRQREVLQLLVEGRSVKEIAFTLNLSSKTVEFHKYRIMEELGVHSMAELVRSALALGIVH